MKIEINSFKNPEKCPINFDSIKWSKVNSNLYYGHFYLKDSKYINVELSDTYHSSLSLHCRPVIWSKDEKGNIVDLAELNWKNYLNHEDYWHTEIEFILPENIYPHSYTITPLKYEYEIWVVASSEEEYISMKEKANESNLEIVEYVD
jgi:hypothetical protein